jgi:hypothetical protein
MSKKAPVYFKPQIGSVGLILKRYPADFLIIHICQNKIYLGRKFY